MLLAPALTITMAELAVTAMSSDPYRAVRNELAAVVEVEHFGAHFLGVDVVERQCAGRATDKARAMVVPTLPMPTTETLAETLADRLARPPTGATGSLTSPSWSQRPRLAQEQDVGAAVSPNALLPGGMTRLDPVR